MSAAIALEITAAAARLVVDEGLEYSAAKRKAVRVLGRHGARARNLPSNEAIEDEVRDHLALFHADTQPAELAALRRLALVWMRRLVEFRPHLAGAVWRGTATRRSPVILDLYCDDPKSAEIALINLNLAYEAGARRDGTDVLSMTVPCTELAEHATLHMAVNDHDALRGALKPDSRGRTWRGDASGVERLLSACQA